MSQKFDKLKTLLEELFQLDQPDLDFGIYRVLHAKSAEVSQFLEKDLLPQVQAAFGQYRSADKVVIEGELAKAIEQAHGLGVDPETTQRVKDLRARLKNDAVDIGALESEVYDHLYSFFRRYYSEGDFLAKRVYKPGVYAIPYEGEEVTLHWANKDQYYIKTSEYLRDYAFRLRPDDDKRPMRVHFRLVDVAEGEHGNVKAAEGKERRFRLAEENTVSVEEGELVVRFTYQPDPTKQKELNAETETAILSTSDAALVPWIADLGKPNVRSDGTSGGTRLRAHLDRYTARNTFDYFIHKDLGGFLRRELDFYIKNEVMHLDDVESETVPRVEQYLSKIKVIRRIAGKIIEFLAQLEDFQKKLWLKKKFVVETQYCITVGCIPEEFYPEIAANEAQREEWVKLFAIDEIEGDLIKPGYTTPMKPEFLAAYPTLVVDTRYFDTSFAARLLEVIGDVDEQTDGALFHGENFQALAGMRARYREKIKCIFIDPPYNTGGDGFPYKDGYQHSSWAAMMFDRLLAAQPLCGESFAAAVTIDDNEAPNLRYLADSVFGRGQFLADVSWGKVYSPRMDADAFSSDYDHVLFFGSGVERVPMAQAGRQFTRTNDTSGKSYRRRSWRKEGSASLREDRPKLFFPLEAPDGTPVLPIKPDGTEGRWRGGRPRYDELVAAGLVEWVCGDEGAWQVYIKQEASDEADRPPSTVWSHMEAGHNHEAVEMVKAMFGTAVFKTPKPTRLIQLVARVSGVEDEDLVLDFFAGSGTTGQAVVDLNREDGARRRFILVEMADYFETVLLARIKKSTFTPEWTDGKPKRLATPDEAARSPRIVKVVRLESYEDALNNLDTRRSGTQQLLLGSPEAQVADGLKEQYLLRYMLDVETRGSQSLLNVQAFIDPTAYKLKVKRPGSDESGEVNVDLLETFNWLIGLTVQHIAAPQTFTAAFERDSEKRLRLLEGRLKQGADGPYWFRTVSGITPDGRKTLVIWRKLTGEPEQDNLVLDAWFTKQGYSAKDSEFDLIYTNGGNNLDNLKAPDDTWKVRLIEEDFHRLMFETEGV